jgi:hypothetical protein
MHPKLQSRIDLLNQELEGLLNDLESFDKAALNHRDQEGQWSVLQVMHHLLRSETLSRTYLEKKMSFQPRLKTAGLPSALRRTVLNFYLNTPIKFKAPKMVGTEQLPEQSTLQEVASSWKQERKALENFLNTLPEDIVRKSVYRHPIAGKLTLDGMLDFFQQHFRRHRKQIERNLA